MTVRPSWLPLSVGYRLIHATLHGKLVCQLFSQESDTSFQFQLNRASGPGRMNHDDPTQEEPAEHLRFWDYLRELEQVAEADEVGLVAEVLTDPVQEMAQSAVLRHLDRRAADLHPEPAYEPWAEKMTQATTRYPRLTRRLHDWSLFRAITLGQRWSPDALLDSSDWLQLKTASASNTTALEILADRGRTKRIRHTARTSMKQQTRS